MKWTIKTKVYKHSIKNAEAIINHFQNENLQNVSEDIDCKALKSFLEKYSESELTLDINRTDTS